MAVESPPWRETDRQRDGRDHEGFAADGNMFASLGRSLAAADQLGEDQIDGSGPEERLGVLVPGREELFDGGDEIVDAEE